MKYTLAAAALLGATLAADEPAADPNAADEAKPAGCAIKVAAFSDKDCKTADKDADKAIAKVWLD